MSHDSYCNIGQIAYRLYFLIVLVTLLTYKASNSHVRWPQMEDLLVIIPQSCTVKVMTMAINVSAEYNGSIQQFKSASWAELSAQIAILYLLTSFKVKYVDDEGDHVTIMCEDDFREAVDSLDCTTDQNELRVFVYSNEPETRSLRPKVTAANPAQSSVGDSASECEVSNPIASSESKESPSAGTHVTTAAMLAVAEDGLDNSLVAANDAVADEPVTVDTPFAREVIDDIAAVDNKDTTSGLCENAQDSNIIEACDEDSDIGADSNIIEACDEDGDIGAESNIIEARDEDSDIGADTPLDGERLKAKALLTTIVQSVADLAHVDVDIDLDNIGKNVQQRVGKLVEQVERVDSTNDLASSMQRLMRGVLNPDLVRSFETNSPVVETATYSTSAIASTTTQSTVGENENPTEKSSVFASSIKSAQQRATVDVSGPDRSADRFQLGVDHKNTNAEDQCAHPGVRCDACDTFIVGARFKCFVCADFDLCTSCMATTGHSPDHVLYLIRRPLTHETRSEIKSAEQLNSRRRACYRRGRGMCGTVARGGRVNCGRHGGGRGRGNRGGPRGQGIGLGRGWFSWDRWTPAAANTQAEQGPETTKTTSMASAEAASAGVSAVRTGVEAPETFAEVAAEVANQKRHPMPKTPPPLPTTVPPHSLGHAKTQPVRQTQTNVTTPQIPHATTLLQPKLSHTSTTSTQKTSSEPTASRSERNITDQWQQFVDRNEARVAKAREGRDVYEQAIIAEHRANGASPVPPESVVRNTGIYPCVDDLDPRVSDQDEVYSAFSTPTNSAIGNDSSTHLLADTQHSAKPSGGGGLYPCVDDEVSSASDEAWYDEAGNAIAGGQPAHNNTEVEFEPDFLNYSDLQAMNQLIELGFTDRAHNARLIRQYGNDVSNLIDHCFE